jgi:hypothetical protein
LRIADLLVIEGLADCGLMVDGGLPIGGLMVD